MNDVDILWKLLDDGDGALSLDELVRGVGRLKGGARSIDLIYFQLELQRVLRLLGAGINYLENHNLKVVGTPVTGLLDEQRTILQGTRSSTWGKHEQKQL